MLENAKPLCKKCSGIIRIIDSRTHVDGRVHRKHECTDCGNIYRTVELLMDDYRKMQEELADLHDMRHLLRQLINK